MQNISRSIIASVNFLLITGQVSPLLMMVVVVVAIGNGSARARGCGSRSIVINELLSVRVQVM